MSSELPGSQEKKRKAICYKNYWREKIFSFFLEVPLKEKVTLTNINKSALNSSCTVNKVIILCLSPTIYFRKIDSVKSPLGRTWNHYNWWNFQGSRTQQGPETHIWLGRYKSEEASWGNHSTVMSINAPLLRLSAEQTE